VSGHKFKIGQSVLYASGPLGRGGLRRHRVETSWFALQVGAIS